MNERIRLLRKFYIEDQAHKLYRKAPLDWDSLIREEEFFDHSDVEKVTEVFEIMLANETPVIFDDEKIPLLRTVVNYP